MMAIMAFDSQFMGAINDGPLIAIMVNFERVFGKKKYD